MSDYISLVARIRYHIEKAKFCGLGDHEATKLLTEAADSIELLNKLYHSAESDHNDMRRAYINEVEKHRSIPAADVRPIVYCRDCKHFTERRACSLLVVGMKEDDFCSYGAKMEVSDA